MARNYTMGFSNVSVAAAQDLLALYAGANGAIEIVSIRLGQKTQTAIGGLRVRIRRLPATVTPGTVGSAGTIRQLRTGDAAATVTGRINDTTQATTGGTAVDLVDDVWELINGYYYAPETAEARPACNPSEAIVVSLDDPPGGAIVCNGSITFRELIPV